MSGVRDHKVFIFKIAYDQQHAEMGLCGEVNRINVWSPATDEVVLIAPDDDVIAKAFFDKYCKFRYKNLRLVEMQKLDIDGALTESIF